MRLEHVQNLGFCGCAQCDGFVHVAGIATGAGVPAERFTMPRVFAYVRVSTIGQTAENQVHEIAAAGFAVEKHRFVSETVSRSQAAGGWPELARLVDRLEAVDVW